MNSTVHPSVQTSVTTLGRRFVAITAATATFAAGSLRAQQYDNMATPDDPFDVQTPSVNEYVTVGDFQLQVDRTKWGIDLYPGNYGVLGRLQGNDVEITIRQISEPLSRKLIAENGVQPTRVERVFTSHDVHGLKAIYGEKPSFLGQQIKAIRYLFVSPSGKTICFEVRARTAHPDWSDANCLVLSTLARARSGQ